MANAAVRIHLLLHLWCPTGRGGLVTLSLAPDCWWFMFIVMAISVPTIKAIDFRSVEWQWRVLFGLTGPIFGGLFGVAGWVVHKRKPFGADMQRFASWRLCHLASLPLRRTPFSLAYDTVAAQPGSGDSCSHARLPRRQSLRSASSFGCSPPSRKARTLCWRGDWWAAHA